jgi:predicted permease
MNGGSLADLLVATVGPPLAVAAVGYLVGTWRQVSVDGLNTVVVYVLLPALVFDSLATSPVGGDTVVALGAAVVAFTLAMLAVAQVAGRGLGTVGSARDALVLAAGFPNVGNFGIPVAAFAFGAAGRSTAVVFVVVQNVLLYTLGVYVISRGEGGTARLALRRVFGLPLVYAVAAAGLAVLFEAVPPTDGPLMRTVGMLGDAAIPLFLLVLGIQLAGMDRRPGMAAVPAAGLRLAVAPLVGLAVALAVGFADPAVARAFVLLCGAPAAVSPLVLFVEFDGQASAGADRYATAVVVTLAGSLPLVAVLLAAFRAGLLG